MSKTPRQRAEACFAIARSTMHDGERQAAIGRGEAICTKHDLSLDSFDIPGRARQNQRFATGATGNFDLGNASTTRPAWGSAIYATSVDGFNDTLRRFSETLRRQADRTGAAPTESPYDATRRRFEAATAEATRRDRERHERRKAAIAVVDWLWSCGVSVYDQFPKGWMVVHDGRAAELSDIELVDLAQKLSGQAEAA